MLKAVDAVWVTTAAEERPPRNQSATSTIPRSGQSNNTTLNPYDANGEEPAASTVEALIEAAVERAIRRALGPYLHRLTRCEPAVYTVAQAAEVLQVSEDTVGRLVRRGTLPRVPHVEGKVLIPRRALDHLTHDADHSQKPVGAAHVRRSTPPPAAGPSARRRHDPPQG